MTTLRFLRSVLVGACAISTCGPGVVAGQEKRAVDVVICLDTSGSMEGLLDSTRARIWDVVNELGKLTPTPELRVGLLSFGNGSSTEADGWIVRHLDLTGDLDSVYAQLMALEIGGSEERVGRVVDEALDGMRWSKDPSALRVIFVAGNESADQGVDSHDFRLAARTARERGIIVNALYAGSREQATIERWPELARDGQGSFAAIDPETGAMQIPTPQDERLLQLNAMLNKTYVPYGARGADGLANQVAQDGNASRLGVDSCSSRIVAKGGALYTNASWDLVDATVAREFDWAALQLTDLPEELRPMTPAQRVAYVDTMRKKRETVQAEIQRVSEQREQFLRHAKESDPSGFGSAMRQAIRDQAKSKGFKCDGC